MGFDGPDMEDSASLPSLGSVLAGRLHIVVIVGVVLYFVVTWAYQRWSNYYKPPPPNPSAMLRNIEAMHEARKRQIEAAKAALAVDAEKERERRERAVEEQRHNTDVRNGIYEDAAPRPTPRPPSARRPPPNILPRVDADDDGNPRPLPKLSGGDRRDWEASNSSPGGGDKPNRFKRDCGPKGG